MIKNSEVYEEVTDQAMARINRNEFYAGFLGKLHWAMREAERGGGNSLSLNEITEVAEEMETKTQK